MIQSLLDNLVNGLMGGFDLHLTLCEIQTRHSEFSKILENIEKLLFDNSLLDNSSIDEKLSERCCVCGLRTNMQWMQVETRHFMNNLSTCGTKCDQMLKAKINMIETELVNNTLNPQKCTEIMDNIKCKLLWTDKLALIQILNLISKN